MVGVRSQGTQPRRLLFLGRASITAGCTLGVSPSRRCWRPSLLDAVGLEEGTAVQRVMLKRGLTALYFCSGLAFCVWLTLQVDMSQVADTLGHFGLQGALVVVTLYFLAFTLDSITWTMVIPGLPTRFIWIWRTWWVRLAGESFNAVVPAAGFGGEPLKVVAMHQRYGLGINELTASLVLSRTVNLVSSCVFLLVGFLLMAQLPGVPDEIRTIAALGLGAACIATSLAVLAQRQRLLTFVSAKVGSKYFDKWRSHLAAFDHGIEIRGEALVEECAREWTELRLPLSATS